MSFAHEPFSYKFYLFTYRIETEHRASAHPTPATIHFIATHYMTFVIFCFRPHPPIKCAHLVLKNCHILRFGPIQSQKNDFVHAPGERSASSYFSN